MKPFLALASGGDFARANSAGVQPRGSVLGAAVVLDASGWSRVYDGGEIENMVDVFGTALSLAKSRITEEANNLNANLIADIDFRLPAHFEKETVQCRKSDGTDTEGEYVVLQLIGTAYHAPEIETNNAPVITNLNAVEVIQLMQNGFHPLGLCVGFAFQYQGLGFRSSNMKLGQNCEHPDFTRSVIEAQSRAIGRMNKDAFELRADGIVGYRTHHRQIHASRSHLNIHLVASGTAVQRDPFKLRSDVEIDPIVPLSQKGKL